MKEILLDIQKHFKQNSFLGIESIRQVVAPRLFQALGWDIWNPREVGRDFQPLADSQTKLDFALFLPGGLHTVFVKLVASAQLQDTQGMDSIGNLARRYDGMHTVSFFILTDGAIWKFYNIPGDFFTAAVCFATLDLLKHDNLQLEVTFRKYLQKSAVQSGSSVKEAISAIGLPPLKETEGPNLFEEPPGSSYQNPHVLGHNLPDDFTYVEIHDGRFAGTRCFNWNELIRFAIGFAYQNGTPSSEFRGYGSLRSTDPQKSSFYPILGTSLWLQTMDAKYAWFRTLDVARLLNIEVSVHFRWQNVTDLPRRREYGLLAWKPIKV